MNFWKTWGGERRGLFKSMENKLGWKISRVKLKWSLLKSFCFSVFLCCYNFVINFNSSTDISAAFISCSSNTNPFTTYTSTDISTLLIFFSSADVSTQFSAYTLTDTSNPFRSSPLNNNNKKNFFSSPNFQRSYTFNSNCFQCRTADTSPCFSVHTYTLTRQCITHTWHWNSFQKFNWYFSS